MDRVTGSMANLPISVLADNHTSLMHGWVPAVVQAVSVALLINLFSYLGTVAILVQWSRRQPRAATAAALAIVALTFSPALVLWSLQPLKDPFFQFLFVAFVAACAAWQRAWVAPGRSAKYRQSTGSVKRSVGRTSAPRNGADIVVIQRRRDAAGRGNGRHPPMATIPAMVTAGAAT